METSSTQATVVTGQHARFKKIFNTGYESIIAISAQGAIEECNEATLKLFQCEETELIETQFNRTECVSWSRGRINKIHTGADLIFALRRRSCQPIIRYQFVSGHRTPDQRFVDDPDMLKIIEMFVDVLSERIKSVLTTFGDSNFTMVSEIAQQLKGASGGYGYSLMSELAFHVGQLEKCNAEVDQAENQAAVGNPLCKIAGEIDSLDDPDVDSQHFSAALMSLTSVLGNTTTTNTQVADTVG